MNIHVERDGKRCSRMFWKFKVTLGGLSVETSWEPTQVSVILIWVFRLYVALKQWFSMYKTGTTASVQIQKRRHTESG